MPRNNRNHNQSGTSGRNNGPARALHPNTTKPFSPNHETQVPYLPTIPSSIPVPERQRDRSPYDELNVPSFNMPIWNDPVAALYEPPRSKAHLFGQEQPNNERQSSSPMLERVRKMRVAEQQKANAQVEGESVIDSTMKPVTTTKYGHKQRSTVKLDAGMSPKTEKAMPELELVDQDWAAPLYTSAKAQKVTLPTQTSGANPISVSNRHNVVTAVQSVNKGADSSDDDVDALVKAIANMHPFQQITCSPSNSRAIQHSVGPTGLKKDKIQARNDDGPSQVKNRHVSRTKNSKDKSKEVEEEAMTVAMSRSPN